MGQEEATSSSKGKALSCEEQNKMKGKKKAIVDTLCHINNKYLKLLI
jgi:hypothetical protein